jgi:hypothetical protein
VSNASQRKGTYYESSLLPLLTQYEPKAHRLGKQGVNDKGDLWVSDPRFVIEAKCEKSYAGKLSGYIAEAEVEACNAGKPHGLVVFKRRGVTDPALQYALTTFGTMLALIYGERP